MACKRIWFHTERFVHNICSAEVCAYMVYALLNNIYRLSCRSLPYPYRSCLGGEVSALHVHGVCACVHASIVFVCCICTLNALRANFCEYKYVTSLY